MRYLIYTLLSIFLSLSISTTLEAQTTTVEVTATSCDCNPTVSCLCEPGPWIPLPCPAPCESFGTQTFYRVYPSTYEFAHPTLGLLSGTCPPPPPGGAVRFEPCFNPTPCSNRSAADSNVELVTASASCTESGPVSCTNLNVIVYDGYPYEVSVNQVYSGSCPRTLSKTTFACADEGLNVVSILDDNNAVVCQANINVICKNGTPCAGNCQASLNPILPTTTVVNTSASNRCEEGDWTYYEHPTIPGKYLFAINWAPDGTESQMNSIAKDNATVSIGVLNSTREISDGNDCTFIMSKYWNVENAGTFDEPVDIRFYFDAFEAVDAISAATTCANNIGVIGTREVWFKQNSYFDPLAITDPNFAPDVILTPVGTDTEDGVSYMEFSGLTSFSGGGFASGTGTALPVELTYFEGTPFENYIMLNWETASELNNEKFEIEESTDGFNFRTIGEVKGNGTTSERQSYSFVVENPLSGVSYYRLKQIDFDGKYEYSKVISFNFEDKDKKAGEFFPNPSKTGNVNLNYTSLDEDEISVAVFDVTGQLAANRIQQVSEGVNNLNFDFSELTPGIYMVRIGDGKNPITRKLVIR